jgi:ADP-ribose pyrophosphatase YjhB (NUDIX family)
MSDEINNICCSCGKGVAAWFHGQGVICEMCSEWGITHNEIFPTVEDVLSEQFHRVGKDGKKYWGRLGGGILFTDGERILLLKRDGNSDYAGHWGIPGGRAKENEAPLDVARRETKEECGSAEGQRFGHFHDKDGAHHFHTYLFAIAKPFDVELSKEHNDHKWVSLEKVEDMKLHPKFKEAWPGYLRAIKARFPGKTSFMDWVKVRDS